MKTKGAKGRGVSLPSDVWPQDVLRHTYASMRLASGTPAAFVAAEMGTSERMLGEHYREIVEESVAERFWDLRP